MRLLSLEEVTTKTTLSRACIYRLIRRGEFPKSTRVTARRICWLEDEIDEWIGKFFTRIPVLGGGR